MGMRCQLNTHERETVMKGGWTYSLSVRPRTIRTPKRPNADVGMRLVVAVVEVLGGYEGCLRSLQETGLDVNRSA